MLAGSTTSGYKACPVCLDDFAATHECGRMVYDGHRKRLSHDHPWRSGSHLFDEKCEFKPRPPSFLILPLILVIFNQIPLLYRGH